LTLVKPRLHVVYLRPMLFQFTSRLDLFKLMDWSKSTGEVSRCISKFGG